MKMNSIKLIVSTFFLSIALVSCNNNSNSKNSSEVEDEKRYLKVVEEKRYSDIDLFTFQPIEFDEIDRKFYVTIDEKEDEKVITVIKGKNKNSRVYKKNLKGYYTTVIQTNTEENNPGYKTFFYIVFSKDRIIYYNLHKFSGELMQLNSYSIILPLEKNNTQRKIVYDIKQRGINNFEEIDYQYDLNKLLTDDFESEMIYEFDFQKKIVHEYSVRSGFKNLNQVYDIKNSKSLATPLKNYWRAVKN
jgi:hypothetical protein